MTGRQLARRTMKARRTSKCPACLGAVTVGQPIVKTPRGWICRPCALAAVRTAATEGTPS